MVLTLGLLMSERQCFKHDFPANRCLIAQRFGVSLEEAERAVFDR
jgi:hypothetical protein